MQWILFFMCLTGATLLTNCTSENVATNGKASQSSDYMSHSPSRAIDGNETLCAHTKLQKDPWWRIDLLGIYRITSVTIFNKGCAIDDAVLNGAEIQIGNSREKNGTANRECITIQNFTKGMPNIFKCDDGPLGGRYVTVHIQGMKYLILCEVQINGTKIASPMKLFKMKKTWEDALDYCRENGTDIVSIPDEQTQAWAELEAMKAETPFVWLGLRYTCVVEFWFWVSDRCFGLRHWAPGNGTTTEECDVSGAMEKTQDHHWVSRPDNEEFNFICLI